MKLVLVRHGETESNVNKTLQGKEGGVLTLKGITQAKDLGKKLKEKYKIDMVFCSPLDRCIKTLKNILFEYQIDAPVFMSKLIEERGFGEFSGVESQMVNWEELNKDNKVNEEIGIESLNELKKRVSLFLEDLKLESDDSTILVVSHSGPIRMAVSILDGKNFDDIVIKNASITEFDYKTEC